MATGTREPVPRLSVPKTGAILFVCVLLFLVGRGPVWNHPWSPDASILWSYAPIPFLVLAALAWERKLTLASFLSETLLVLCLKFGITALILIVLWSASPPPPPLKPPLPTAPPAAGPSAAPPPSRLDRVPVLVGGGRILPDPLVLAPGRGLALRSADGRLHAVALFDEAGEIVRNVPVLPSGQPSTIAYEDAARARRLRCTVHPEERADLAAGETAR